MRHLQQVLTTIFGDWELASAVLILATLVLLAVLGPLLWPRDPLEINILDSLQPPSARYPMGTDGVGRDIFARFNSGAQISLLIGVVVAAVGAFVGGLLGIISGLAGGWVDAAIMRVMDSILAFPPLILAMAVTVGLGVGLETAAIGITVTSIPWYARLLRGEVLRIRSLMFVEAARAIGVGHGRMILRHITPHLLTTLLIQASSVFGFSILTLAALGFVGLGAQIPTPEWGAMITEGLQYALTGQWWIGVFPGLGVLLAVTAANMLADRMRDLLDPKGNMSRG